MRHGQRELLALVTRCIVILTALSLPTALFLPNVSASPGDLDPSFGSGGKTTTAFSNQGDFAEAVAAQPDGKLIAAGGAGLADGTDDFALARYNPDGSLDQTFGVGGRVTTDFFGHIDFANGVAIQPSDGKIVAVGVAVKPVSDHFETYYALARYQTDGKLDPTFGSGGIVTTDVLNMNINQNANVVFVQAATSVRIQTDNKIVVAGGIIDTEAAPGVTPAPLGNFGLARYNVNGTLDTNFGAGGKTGRGFFNLSTDTASSLALQADGKIVAAGFTTKDTGNFDEDFACVRFNSDGSLDSSFGSNGVITDFFGGNDEANAIVIQLDGKIILGGVADRTSIGGSVDMALARYNVDGSLDNSFGSGGKVLIDYAGRTDLIYGLALQTDGKILAAGTAGNNSNTLDLALARLNSNGTLDPSFGSGGKVTTDFFGNTDYATALLIQADGKIVGVGVAFDALGNSEFFALARYVNSAGPPTVQFNSSSYTVNEGDGRVNITLTRGGDTTSSASVSYATNDAAGLTNCNVFNGIASPRCDYENTIGTATWAAGDASAKTFSVAIVDDSYVEGTETFTVSLSNPTGGTLGPRSTATVTILDNDLANGPNPIDGTDFFVRQQYIDFLGREPDPPGFAGWTSTINNCAPGDTNCDRIHVSQLFFQSAEFQDRGYFVYRFYPVAFGRKPDYGEFVPDLASVSGFLDVNQLEAAKVAFIAGFMARPAFAGTYNGLTNQPYVDMLLNTANAGIGASARQGMIDGLNNLTLTRAQVLRQIVESTEVSTKYNHQAYAVMEYFGYLRRQPDGFYLDWITVLDATNNPRGMVTGFVNSQEYRNRFGP
jgi:uncharacterized delta-60 repeat protein